MRLFSQLQSDPIPTLIALLYEIPAILIALTLHELAHGYVALRCGDPTARMMGRMTLNPFKHLDPVGVLMMLVLGLYEDVRLARQQLLACLEKRGYHFYVGMLGMQYLLPACDMCGLQEEGYRLLTAHGYPSYRNWFEHGATTMYETFQDGNSKNHHMYSCVIAWFHNTILGIRQTEQLALKHTLTLAPYFLSELQFAQGSFETAAGRISVDWHRQGENTVQLTIEIPAGVQAALHLTGYAAEGQTDCLLTGGKHCLTAEKLK